MRIHSRKNNGKSELQETVRSRGRKVKNTRGLGVSLDELLGV